jgi:hypothetical protein
MAATAEARDGNREVELDVPADREYETREDERLDEALVEAIRAARAAENNYLAELLETELGSLYYEPRESRVSRSVASGCSGPSTNGMVK